MSEEHRTPPDSTRSDEAAAADDNPARTESGDEPPREIGGRAGPDPTRFGDWEKNGRCVDF